MSYRQLDAAANRLAHWLMDHASVGGGTRVGLHVDRAVDGYVGLLAVTKAGGTYVPLDRTFPADRIAFIAADAELDVVLTRSSSAPGLALLPDEIAVVAWDEIEAALEDCDPTRPAPEGTESQVDPICYVIYTSGTTGRPKGVPIRHSSIVNFVRVAAESYGYATGDRVYQGLTVAFDFYVEEVLVPWMAGATLVPKPDGGNLVGDELHAFLVEGGVTAMCCVPTLLATIGEDLPALRLLIVSGEACPGELAARWHRPDRRFLNVYGPTEATVTATWTVLSPDRPLTIGVPLPTYAVVILDPEDDRVMEAGELGEIGIAGPGLADGYLNRPDRTAAAFRPDFIGIPDNPSGRIYRTGDLGRVGPSGEVEHHGRIDTQVKIRGYRIELAEIEAVIGEVPGVAQALVSTHTSGGVVELVGYYTRERSKDIDRAAAYERLRDRLPAYMVPTYLEPLDAMPTMVSGKVDRARLPAPTGPRRLAGGPNVAPAGDLERTLADHLAAVLHVDRVSVTSHFFDELGASSLLMARFSTATRSLPGVGQPISIRDIYLHPTVRELAAAIGARPAPAPLPVRSAGEEAVEGTPHFVLAGVAQVLVFLAYLAAAAAAVDAGAHWLAAGHGILGLYGRALAFGSAVVAAMSVVPIVAKWSLVGRWRPGRVRAWSLPYVRFWVVKTLVMANPLVRLCIGTPLYNLYLRALGADIGPGAVILTQHVPICTDLLTVGAGAVIRKDTWMNGYRAHEGTIETGPVTIGAGAFVGEHSVLDIDTELGAGAELGHSSSLHPGQSVPDGEVWHGSPGRPTRSDHSYRTVDRHATWTGHRVVYCALRLIIFFAVTAPLEAAVATVLLTRPELLRPISIAAGFGLAAALLVLYLALATVIAFAVPRLLAPLIRPDRDYPLYGLHFAALRLVSRVSNIKSLTALLGDSVAIVGYLKGLGYDLGQVEQTGSNFGTEVKQEIPALSAVGSGTMVSDGLSLMNVDYSDTTFRLRPVRVADHNYLGNDVAYPTDAKVGADCLLGTKVMVPVDGETRSGVGLLGSPPFEIPRSVSRDHQFDHVAVGDERHRRVAAKTRHNLVTMAMHLFVRYLFVTIAVLVALSPIVGDGWWGTAAGAVADVVGATALFVLVERLTLGFGRLEPKVCSIYEPDFWAHERYWKVPSTAYLALFNGTPFKGFVWRLLGVRTGAKVFDDGCGIVERTLVTLGSGCTLGAGSTLQSHSLEEGVFKSDHIHIGEGASVGTAAYVNYAVTFGAGATLEADSFLMKGSDVPAAAAWGGNPAVPLASSPNPLRQRRTH